jgi:valyl-tRNA synthetase
MHGQLNHAVAEGRRLIAEYDFSAFADLLYRTIFDSFCDWYLELLKVGQASPAVAGYLLEQLLALANPVIPFVTEECYAQLPGAKGMLLTHPLASGGDIDGDARDRGKALIEAVTAIRAFKADNGMKLRDDLAVALQGEDGRLPAEAVAALAHVTWSDVAAAEAQSITLTGTRLLVERPTGAVDIAAECARLAERVAAAEQERARAERQLANPNFVERAPEHLVAAERDKLDRFVREIAELDAERVKLGCVS